MSQRPFQVQVIVPFTPMVKALMIINVTVWLFFQVILEQFFLSKKYFTFFMSLIPESVIFKYYIWQPVTYMFLHSLNWTHIVFNMLILWWLGADLEQRWGSKFFLIYYLVSGVGAAIIYTAGMATYCLIRGEIVPLEVPVLGASGAIFGLLFAFGKIFGERIVYFMMIFPMRARYFVILLGVIEILTLTNQGVAGSGVANLAHLGGLAAGFFFLTGFEWWKRQNWRGGRKGPGRRNLKLVVSNSEEKKAGKNGDGPRYWN